MASSMIQGIMSNFHDKSPYRLIESPEAPKFDLESYISNYTGKICAMILAYMSDRLHRQDTVRPSLPDRHEMRTSFDGSSQGSRC